MLFIEHKNGFSIWLKVQAGAKINRIIGPCQLVDKIALKIQVQADAHQGEANLAIVKLLARSWQLNTKEITIIKGEKSSNKLILLTCLSHQLPELNF